MIQKIKIALIALVSMAFLATPMLVPAAVSAQAQASGQTDQIQNGLCAGSNLDASNTQCNQAATGAAATTKINNTITLVINIFSLVVGVVSIIMIIIGGLRYIISGGDSANVTSAKNTILYAIIGLAVVALSQFIVQFVLNKIATSGT